MDIHRGGWCVCLPLSPLCIEKKKKKNNTTTANSTKSLVERERATDRDMGIGHPP